MPTPTEITRQIGTNIRILRNAVTAGDAGQVGQTLARLNEALPAEMIVQVKDRQVCVRLMGRRGVPAMIERVADYIEQLHTDGTVVVYKDRQGETEPPDWPDFTGHAYPSVWDHLMSDDTGS